MVKLYPQLASKETFQVEVIGEEPVEVTELYLAQIISARLVSLNKSNTRFGKKTFVRFGAGWSLIGGNAILPVSLLAQEVLGVRKLTFQTAVRNPVCSCY